MTVDLDTDFVDTAEESFFVDEVEGALGIQGSSDDEEKQVGWYPYDTLVSLARSESSEKPSDGMVSDKVASETKGALAHLKALLAGQAATRDSQMTESQSVGAANSLSQGAVLSNELQANPWAMGASDTLSVSKGDIKPLSVSAVEEDEKSYLDAAVDEICDWAAWLWDSVNPFSDSDNENHGTTEIGKNNSDGSTNPFGDGRRILTESERRQFRQQTAEMNRLFDKLRELLDDDQFELVMHLVLLESQRARREGGDVVQEQMIESYRKKAKFNKARLKEAEAFVRAAQRSRWWGKFEEFATTLGLTAAAVTTIGYSGWGVVALVYLVGIGYNRWHEDFVERGLSKQIASATHKLFGWKKKDTEPNAYIALKIGGGILNIIVTLPFASVHWLGNVMEGAMTLVNVHVKIKTDHAQGRLYKIDYELNKTQKGISGQVKKFGKLIQAETEDQKMAAKALQDQEDMIKGFIEATSGKA